MRNRLCLRQRIAGLLLCAAVFGTARAEDAAAACRLGATPMARVELYLGGAGSRRAWMRFLADVVTPRFPDGLTSLDGYGQWRGPRGISREASHVLIILYRPNGTSEARIEAIRLLYKRRFRQTSVLRIDSPVCVSF